MSINTQRPLSGPERVVWKRDSICLNIVLSASLTGSIHTDKLQRAWSVLQGKHPLLRAHLVEEQGRVELSFTDSGPIPIREIQVSSEHALEEELIRELQTPFTPIYGQALVRSVLLHSSKSVELILCCHHCICDALSVSYLLRDVLYCLSGQEDRIPEYSDIRLSSAMLPQESKLSLPVKSGIALANFFAGVLMPPMKEAKKIVMKESRVVLWDISKEQTQGFLAACKAEGVTVHAGLSTIFQAAQKEVLGEKSIYKKIYTPVNVRTRLSPMVGDNFGLFASEAYIPGKYDNGKSFWDNCRLFNNRIKLKTGNTKVLGLLRIADSLTPRTIDRISVFLMKRLSSFYFGYIISNLGNLDFDNQYSTLQLTAMHGPVIYIPQVEKSLTILTVNGQLFFTLTYQPEVIDPAQIQAVKEFAMKLLLKNTLPA
jgi:NRPS condensation-like uncharacterized protein